MYQIYDAANDFKKWGGQIILCPPHIKKWGGQVPPVPPLSDAPAYYVPIDGFVFMSFGIFDHH